MESLAERSLVVQGSALASGALVPLQTDLVELPNGGAFVLRRLLSAKPKHLRPAGPKPNPFLPCDPRLEVCSIHEHVVLLNKYPVQPGHLLLITKAWEPQTGWLKAIDFQALLDIWNAQPGFWFFNSGPDAGASQPHRHLQLLPRTENEQRCPMDGTYLKLLAGENPTQPWQQRLGCRGLSGISAIQSSELYDLYLELAHDLGLGRPETEVKPLIPYNLLISDRWMVMVPRGREAHAGFSINGLGFAGYLLATSDSDLAWLERHGPGQLLDAVSA